MKQLRNKHFEYPYFLKRKDKGVALLFAVMLVSILLTISLGVLSILIKETNFSLSTKDANKAFFAADSGVECALFYVRQGDVFKLGIGVGSLNCSENDKIEVTEIPSSESSLFNFFVPNLGSDGDSCARVEVTVYTDVTKTPQIISKGYNIADDSCYPTARSTERVIQVNL